MKLVAVFLVFLASAAADAATVRGRVAGGGRAVVLLEGDAAPRPELVLYRPTWV